jgi:hypothetical protein
LSILSSVGISDGPIGATYEPGTVERHGSVSERSWCSACSPTDAARKFLPDQGVAAGNRGLAGYRDQGFIPIFPFAGDATGEFRGNGADPPKKLVAELSRTVYFLPWRASAFREKVEN